MLFHGCFDGNVNFARGDVVADVPTDGAIFT